MDFELVWNIIYDLIELFDSEFWNNGSRTVYLRAEHKLKRLHFLDDKSMMFKMLN